MTRAKAGGTRLSLVVAVARKGIEAAHDALSYVRV